MERQNSFVPCSRSVLRRRKHNLTELFLDACWVGLDSALRTQPRRNQSPQRFQDESPQQILDQPPQRAEDAGEEEQDVSQQVNPGFIFLQGYSRAPNTPRRCIFLNCRNMATQVVPLYVKFHLLHTNNFYIPPLARVCHSHLQRNNWEELNTQRVMHEFNNTHVLNIIDLYKWGLERRNQLDFEDINSVDDNELHFWTGVTKHQLSTVLQLTQSLHNRTDSPAMALGINLTKIRTGEPDERLATKF